MGMCNFGGQHVDLEYGSLQWHFKDVKHLSDKMIDKISAQMALDMMFKYDPERTGEIDHYRTTEVCHEAFTFLRQSDAIIQKMNNYTEAFIQEKGFEIFSSAKSKDATLDSDDLERGFKYMLKEARRLQELSENKLGTWVDYNDLK